jgi:3-oxoacyl-[acyl-carrier protein] reductase
MAEILPPWLLAITSLRTPARCTLSPTSRSAAIRPSAESVSNRAARTAIFAQMTEEHIAYMLSKIPRARFVEVEEIAALAAFCASAECSFTTGAVFDISGGRATY